MIKRFIIIIFYFLAYDYSNSENYPKKKLFNNRSAPAKILGREDRKYGDHSGNRVLCRFYNFGSIGDQSSSFSGVYPIGSGHS